MANAVAGMVVSLGLNAVEYFQGLTKAEYSAKKFAQSFDSQMNTVRTTIKTIGVGLIVNEIYQAGKSIVNFAAQLNDFADQTGSSIEALSKLANQARIAGTPFEELQSAVLKLSASMGGVDKKSRQVQEILKTLGVTTKDPAEAMQQIAVALSKYEDGVTKAAYATILFDKGNVKFLATLKDMAQLQDVQATLTKKQTKEAEELEQSFRRIGAQATGFSDIILSAVVPALQASLNAAIEFAKSLVGIQNETDKLQSDARIREYAEDTARSLAFLVDAADGAIRAFRGLALTIGASFAQLAASAKLNFGEVYRIGKEWQADMQALLERPLFSAHLENAFAKMREGEALAKQRRLEDRGFDPFAKKLPPPPARGGGRGSKVDQDALAVAKRTLDSQLAAQETFMRDEQLLLRERESFLQSYYRDDLISLENYYGGRQHAAEHALQNTLAAIDKEIEAQRAFAKAAQTILAKDPEKREASRIQTETEIAKLIAERARVEHAADVQTAESMRDKTRAEQQYKDSVLETNAAVLQMMGNERAAAEIRQGLQNRSAIAKATLAGDAAQVANIRALEKQALSMVDLNEAAGKYQKTLEALSMEQARIALAEAAGNITTLEAMARRQAAAEKHIVTLREQIAIQERIAETLVGPAYDEAIAKIQRMKLEIDVLEQSAKELENTFRKTFEDAFADNFANVITGTKSVKQAFKDMANDILGDLARMASRNIAQTIFGSGGVGGGIGGILGGIFGGSGGGTPPWVISEAGAWGGGLAYGGPVAAGTPYMVGERGPEMFIPKTAGTVVANNQLGQRGNFVFNINVPAGASRSTIDQTRVKFGLELQNALDRGS